LARHCTPPQPFFERWLHIPYAGKTSYRQEVVDGVGRCHFSRGELAEARRLLPEARGGWLTHSLAPLVQLWDGSWGEVDALAARVLETSRRTGNRWDEYSAQHVAGLVRYLRGDHEAAVGRLEEALAIVADGGARFFEAWVRPDLARVLAESGRVADARAHVDRCREIFGSGEDWRGMTGTLALADAVVLAREDRLDDAERIFGEAQATFDRHRLRGDQAHTMHEWGRALARGGAHDLASEKLNQAVDLYRRHDAGQPWLARVAAERWS